MGDDEDILWQASGLSSKKDVRFRSLPAAGPPRRTARPAPPDGVPARRSAAPATDANPLHSVNYGIRLLTN